MKKSPATQNPAMAEPDKEEDKRADINFIMLAVGILIMLTGSIYPMIFADKDGQASHSIAIALFWSMSAGLVRGVGFIPENKILKYIFSAYACASGIIIALLIRFI